MQPLSGERDMTPTICKSGLESTDTSDNVTLNPGLARMHNGLILASHGFVPLWRRGVQDRIASNWNAGLSCEVVKPIIDTHL